MDNKIKNYFVIGILVVCLLSLVIGAFNTALQGIKANSEKTKKLQNVLGSTAPKIALIRINGVIGAETEQVNIFSGDFGNGDIQKTLKMAKEDNSVKAIILKINSPGGTVATSQNIYYEVMRIRQIKPVIVLMDDMAASGGYYVASAADRIIAQEGTLTGSIGVIMQMMDAHKLFTDKLGIKSNIIKSGTFKDAGSPSKEMTAQERQLFQGVVNDAYAQFKGAIVKGRVQRNDTYSVPKQNLTTANLNKYADGRIFTGQQAYKLGFVDILGDLELAQAVAGQMASEKFGRNYTKLQAVNYSAPTNFSQIFFGATESLFRNDGIKSYLPQSMNMSKTPLYLWE